MYAAETRPRASAIFTSREPMLTPNAIGTAKPNETTTSRAGIPRKNSM
jgi:hypothetical protein